MRRQSSITPGTVAVSLALLATAGAVAVAATKEGARSSPGTPPKIRGYVEPGASVLFEPHMEFRNENGTIAVSFNGEAFDTAGHPFFKPRANGRGCISCHQPMDAMSISTKTLRERWEATGGKDPLFDLTDGANCPNLPRGDRKSHSLLLDRGLFRIGLPWPPKDPQGKPIEPEFTIEVARDPTGCNTDPQYGLHSAKPTVSVYRRARMAANVRYLESAQAPQNTKTGLPLVRDPVTGVHSSMSIMSDARVTSLVQQAQDAGSSHMGMRAAGGGAHAGDMGMSRAEAEELVEFQRKVHAAQQSSNVGGRFDVPNTPRALGVKALIEGRGNPPVNGNDTDVGVFYLMDEWKDAKPGDAAAEFKASVARGYDVFFLKPLWLRDVVGISNIGLGNPYKQTCAFCHNTLLTGHDDVPGWMDLGVNNFPHAAAAPELPTFKITCKPTAAPHPYLGREIYTHDPGRALVSGKCMDVGALVMQQFRGLSSRAPYFANGSARSIREVVDFYDRRFDIGYSDEEKADLINFLSAL